MDTPSTKGQLLNLIIQERAAFDECVAGLSDDRFAQPGVAGHLSAKDILAHVMWWEQWMLRKLRGEALPFQQPGEDQDAAIDRTNDDVYRQHHDRPLVAIKAESRHSYQEVLEAMTNLSENGWRENLGPIAANTYEHYREHATDIRAWRDREALS